MAVEVNSVGKGVEISWDELAESGPPDESERPDGFPSHPIAPGGGEQPSHPIAPGGEAPDQGLPGDQPRPDQGLPGAQPGVEQPIFLPPYVDNILPGELREKFREYMEGNLPPAVQPTGGKVTAVQVFAQGQDGDWSNTAIQPNDGLALLRYPEGFSGESYVEVRGLDGSLVDSGTITVE